jgi:hypothetical protein
VPDSVSLNLTSALTVEGWVNPSTLNSLDQGWCAAVAKEHQNSGNDICYALYAAQGTGTGPALHVLIGSQDIGVGAPSVLPLNTWTFLAGIYDGTTLSIYVNGVLAASLPVSGAILVTSDPLRIGGDWSGEMFTGIIDDVRIYNSALNQSQLQTDMNRIAANGSVPLGMATALPFAAPATAPEPGTQTPPLALNRALVHDPVPFIAQRIVDVLFDKMGQKAMVHSNSTFWVELDDPPGTEFMVDPLRSR